MRYMITVLVLGSILLAGYTKLRKPAQLAYTIDQEELERVTLKKYFSAVRCTPDWSTYHLDSKEIRAMIPLPGTGAHAWKISTNSDSAQFYFNQGINLYYGFHIIEALPSFKKAQIFDPGCALLYWAEALAYGPNINDMDYTASPDALTAISKAMSAEHASSEKERGLILAMRVRYSNDTLQTRANLNRQYAAKMKELYRKYAGDAEIGALYADALLVQHPWDLWQNNGLPKPWTPEIQTVLEATLRSAPDHPGAIHYYIHTVEASPFAWKASTAADRLGRLMPGLSHVVHMPSHIYIRTGQYKKGIEVNKAAVTQYELYKKAYPEVVNNAVLYDIHNRHMQASCSFK